MIATIETSSKTSVQIAIDYRKIVGGSDKKEEREKSYNIEKKIISMTTDNASANNVFKHRSDLDKYSCCAHNLHLALKHSFDIKKTDADYSSTQEIDALITACKEMVTYAKRTSLNSQLDKTLKQSCETRWDSTLELLMSIQESLDQLKEFAEESEDLNDKLLPIHPQLLDEVIKLLIPFQQAREKLCKNSRPTFHEVAVIKHGLLNVHLAPRSDPTTIKKMKERMRKFVEQKFPVTVENMSATFWSEKLFLH